MTAPVNDDHPRSVTDGSTAVDGRAHPAASLDKTRLAPSERLFKLLLALVILLAAAPATGWPIPTAWFAFVGGLVLADWRLARRPAIEDDRAGRVIAWLLIAVYSVSAAYLVMFQGGVGQTLGVTLYGVIIFEALVRDYANTRRLLVNLFPPVVSIIVVQLGAAATRVLHHRPQEIITLLASPFAVFWVFRSLRSSLVDSRRRLSDATSRAEAAAVAKADFLANMSHEIRTPLTAILGFSDILRQIDGQSEEAKRCTQRISAGGHTLLAVVNDILEFSKLEAGLAELALEPFDAADAFRSAIDLVAAQAAAKGLTLSLELATDLPAYVQGDPLRIRQVLLNLLSNAIKFTAEGGVLLRAAYAVDAGRLEVSVSDTGMGIAPDKQDRLFERFSQVDGSITRRHGGTGLGLAICKSLLELMGGHIRVHSIQGAGSTFSFELIAPEASAPVGVVMSKAAAASAAVASASILIVDDLPENRELARRVLEAIGYEIVEADGGGQALEAAAKRAFDLILMDVQMPDMDGLTATRALRRAQGPNAGTPILALSANVMASQVAECLGAGMNDHVAKPLQIPELLGKAAYWIDRARASAQTEPGRLAS